MYSFVKFSIGFLLCFAWFFTCDVPRAEAGVSQSIQDYYKSKYENKAMYLKIPIYAQKETVYIEGRNFRTIPGSDSPLHKVGEQFRITRVDFDGDEIRFRLSGMSSPVEVEIIFSFPVNLQENFQGREVFDAALQSTFTEGLTYTDIEEAKTGFLKEEFDRSINRIANATALNRTVVLEKVAPLIPDYSEVEREKNQLDARVQALSEQIKQLQDESFKLESKLKENERELTQVKTSNATMRENLDGSRSQIENLEAELRDTKEKAQKYEREIANIRNSLNTEADSNRDLSRNNAELADRIDALRSDLKEQQDTNARLSDEIEDYEAEVRKMNSTIKTLTSNKNSINSQYVKLKDEKEKLDEFILGVNALHAHIVEETTEGDIHSVKAGIYADDIVLGYLAWEIPSYLSYNGSKSCRAKFEAESIDRVKLGPEQRQVLRTLGDQLKIQLNLDPASPTMVVSTGEESAVRDLAEREDATWDWQISNNGTQDVSILLTAHLVNKNSQEISLFREEYVIESSNPVRRIRSYLKPIPLAIGVVLGFLLFGIVGIFRRPKSRKREASQNSNADSNTYTNQKKL